MDARAVRALLCCLVVLGGMGASVGLAPLVGAGTAVGHDGPIAADVDGSGSGIDTDSTSATAADAHVSSRQEEEPSLSGYYRINVEIDLHGNGSATWAVEYRYRLDDGNETVDWESLRQDIEDRPEAYLESFEDRREETLVAAENETGRNMTMSNFAVETDESADPQYGKVRFTFDWGSFSHVEVNRIEAGDALEGFVIDERTRLIVSWPDEYQNASIEPEPDDSGERSVLWSGEETREFVDGEPRIELIQTGGDPIQSPSDAREELPLSWLAGLGIGLLAALAVGWWWMTQREESGDRDGDTSDQPAGSVANAEPATDVDEPDEPTGPPLELLSNEERVMRLLEQHGGRIKQQQVVAELDWTEAKTSQVVSGLREEEQIEVFRIGRENVLSIPDDADDRVGLETDADEDELDASGEP
ncbi:hypothetical protein OB955_05075 [Halobacteria archaeon AArc-m2/3/4]|uniref:IclR helix-turn-helix domain-containing protein n=1 Tax=Natronoglomus mannanivorans TaxID=2979990 RepID=A0AAP3E3P5_9EURY|nr:hypothetical protein [Halobacteria archaeon AArc-xg1-1]MCU4972104.1 hypothetical protein [Halobacteria archaeon AArc-m2/3/4]